MTYDHCILCRRHNSLHLPPVLLINGTTIYLPVKHETHCVIVKIQILRREIVIKVYSKWSYAFLDQRSNEYTCARKSTCFVSRIIQCDYNSPAITPFSVGCFSGGTCGTNTEIKTSIHGFNQSALKHGRRTFLYSAIRELVRSGQLWAKAALRQLRSFKVG